MDYKELAEICGYLSDTPSYTAFHDKVERDVICNSCKGGLCYEKVQDAHWCMYEALQRAAVAITDLLDRAEAAEARAEKMERERGAYKEMIYKERPCALCEGYTKTWNPECIRCDSSTEQYRPKFRLKE